MVTSEPLSDVEVQKAVKTGLKSPNMETNATGHLLSDRISSLAIDSHYVWVGTDRGLSRYDRVRNSWKNFTVKDGLADNTILSIALDSELVWIGTKDGVSRYDIKTDRWTRYMPKNGLAEREVSCIAVDGKYVWFGTTKGLSRYDKEIDSWAKKTKADGLADDKVNDIALDGNRIWIATAGGVNRYDKGTDSWNTYDQSAGLVDNNVIAIAVDAESVWFGTENKGMSRYDKRDEDFVRTYTKNDQLVSDRIATLFSDGTSLWLGTADSGAQRYLKMVKTWMQYTTPLPPLSPLIKGGRGVVRRGTITDGLPSNHITAITSDGGEIWFGTYENGVAKYDMRNNTWTVYTEIHALSSNDVKSVLATKDNVWVATSAGLNRLDQMNSNVSSICSLRSPTTSSYGHTTTKADGLVSNDITCVAEENGRLWVGTPRGLGKKENDKWTFYTKDGLADDFVTCLAYGDGLLWIGTKAGLSTYNPTTHQWNTHPGKLRILSRINAIDNIEHIVWIAIADGLVRYDASLDEAMTLTEDNGLPSNYVNTVVVGKGSVWVGTRAGLARIRYHGPDGRTQTIRVHHPISPHPPSEVQPLIEPLSVFTVADGLPNNNVRAITIDDDLPEIIWIGTPAGLAKYDSEADKWMTYTRENTDGGLASDNITSISITGSQLWVGTIAGVSCLDKKENQWIKYASVATTEILRENNVSKLQADGDYIWFGNWNDSTDGAIGRFDKQTGTFKFFSKNDLPLKPTENPITSLRWIEVDENNVWFGTNGGLLRYSKVTDTWLHYTKADGLANNNVYQVVVDGTTPLPPLLRGKYVWISHAGGMVSRYDWEKDEWKIYEICKSAMWSNVGSIAAGQRYVWFTTTWSGVKRYDKQTDTWSTFAEPQGLGADETNQVLIDGDYAWVSAWGDTSQYDTRTDRWKIFDSRRVLSGVTMWMDKGQDGVWFMYSGGDQVATKYHRPTDSWVTLKIHRSERDEWEWGQPNQAVETDEDVWFATGGRGLFRYNKASKSWTIFNEKNGLASNRINDRSLLVDDDYVWVGTDRGLCRYDKRAETWLTFTQSLSAHQFSERKVYAIAIDGRYVWVGAGNGLYRYDKQTDRLTAYPDKRQSVTAIAIDEEYVWVGTTNGLNRLNKAANNFQEYKDKNGLPSNRVLDVALFGLDLWVATDVGVGLYNRNSDDPNAWETYTHTLDIQATQESKEYSASLASNDVRCIAADEKFVWCGTELGVSRYDKSRRTWTTYTSEDGLLGKDIGAIAIDGDDIWFGTDMGATKYNLKSHDFVTYTKTDGLASDVVTCIAVNNEKIWFGSLDAGATRYDKATKTWRVFTKSDGLLHNRVYAIAFDGDYVWFGTESGLSRYDEKTGTWTAYAEFPLLSSP